MPFFFNFWQQLCLFIFLLNFLQNTRPILIINIFLSIRFLHIFFRINSTKKRPALIPSIRLSIAQVTFNLALNSSFIIFGLISNRRNTICFRPLSSTTIIHFIMNHVKQSHNYFNTHGHTHYRHHYYSNKETRFIAGTQT